MNKTRLKAYMLMNYQYVPGISDFAWWIEPHCIEQLEMLDKHKKGEVSDTELLNFAYRNRPK